MEYRLVTHLRSGEIAHVVEAEHLVIRHEKTGREERIAFEEVTEINLRQEAPGAWTARMKRASGPAITIPSRHFVGLGRFEQRGDEYVRFLESLHRASRAVNPRVRYVAGSSALFALGIGFVIFAALFCVAIVAGILWGPKNPPFRILFIVPVLLVVGLGFITQGRTVLYDPESLPGRFLPPR
jgi:hypothetical protein